MTIKELRTSLKLSQTAFAKEIGVSQVTIAHLESGRMKPSSRITEKVKEMYGVSPEPAEKKEPAKKLEIYIQSPLGGNIMPEEVLAKIPEGSDSCFVRVDQNLIWWVRGEETGAVEIWE